MITSDIFSSSDKVICLTVMVIWKINDSNVTLSDITIRSQVFKEYVSSSEQSLSNNIFSLFPRDA